MIHMLTETFSGSVSFGFLKARVECDADFVAFKLVHIR